MALGPFPPLSVQGIQESKARGGAQQQSQPGARAAQGLHDAPAARGRHREQGRRGGGRFVSVAHHPTPNPWR